MSPASATLHVGDTLHFTGTTTHCDPSAFEHDVWLTDVTGVVDVVDRSGLVKAIGVGQAKLGLNRNVRGGIAFGEAKITVIAP